ncbi:MAG TPA: exodeoxyribonuclease VII large subunit [Candidatus Poseidoniaceae archaeon]|nr:MAG TPA: exodeoxyribonuclease VII large subunit [Candidatus Poseidoniales archaeon]HII37336.1 exodeoxyribonuclease VII large subunit [Candidatus Poseidoniaceae archaeon]|tara:strand:+ start:1519 stop:2847 length:1329 start_codon:yes stop_codon:yes gene_type:complete
MRTGNDLTTGPIPVGQFVNLVRNTLKQDKLFQNQVITGEITQWKRHSNGHTYFTLIDSDGQISAVIWQGRCNIDPLIEEGSVVVVIANLDLWAKAGKIQLVVSKIALVNKLGALEDRKKQLIADLRNEGLLDRTRLELPTIPHHIAIITGSGSAALADMNRLIDNRWPGLRRTIIGVMVQGENAPGEIVRGLLAASKLSVPEIADKMEVPPVDLIIVGRGGGAPEDLWAFNLEPVVRAIVASRVPVVSAVGHESDLMVADLVADLRASTPSNAIELTVPEYDYHQMLNVSLLERLDDAAQRIIIDWRRSLQLLQSRLVNAPLRGVYNAYQHVSELGNRLSNIVADRFSEERQRLHRHTTMIEFAIHKKLADETTRLAVLNTSLNSSNPRNVLHRGYSMITNKSGSVISKTDDLTEGQQITLALADGRAKATVDGIEEGDKNE